MRKIVLLSVLTAILYGCGSYDNGELTGVQDRGKYFEPEPFGMVLVQQGSFTMGPNDQDAAWAQSTMSKTVSVDAFYMDQTEITNNEYRQFVYWVRDSIMRLTLAQGNQAENFQFTEDELGNELDPPLLNWETKIELDDQETYTEVEPLFLEKEERFFGRREFDTRKLIYEYYWVDLQQAAKKTNRYDWKTGEYEGYVINDNGDTVSIKNLKRKAFVLQDRIAVYPDTLCWVADFTYSFNEPLVNMYFWHPAYDNYPVVGVSWKQASAFCVWRTQYLNNFLGSAGEPPVQDYRLPLESEWEYAARGGLALSMYPWGGPYTRNNVGCFLANFKPIRGNYGADGGMTTVKVGSYEPNDFGLYDMAGNVAEWTANAFDASAYVFTHDLNPDYKYNAKPSDPPVMKRKVVRGGSWKDISYFMQNATRSYEYQDTSKSYIGFRCVRSFLGNSN